MPMAMRKLILSLLAVTLAACQQGQGPRPVPSVTQIGGDLKCAAGDHGFEDLQAGWGFCYPGTWRYTEKSINSVTPLGLDLTFDITDVPCVTASAAPNTTPPPPSCAPGAGLFAFMIISTFQRGDAPNLASWIQANLPAPSPSSSPQPKPSPESTAASPSPSLQSIQWGNSIEAARLDDGRRVALTKHHVVILDLRSGTGNLDLESSMSARLSTWKFSY